MSVWHVLTMMDDCTDILKQKFLGKKGDAEVCETEGT